MRCCQPQHTYPHCDSDDQLRPKVPAKWQKAERWGVMHAPRLEVAAGLTRSFLQAKNPVS